jgi:hypothetical protein
MRLFLVSVQKVASFLTAGRIQFILMRPLCPTRNSETDLPGLTLWSFQCKTDHRASESELFLEVVAIHFVNVSHQLAEGVYDENM